MCFSRVTYVFKIQFCQSHKLVAKQGKEPGLLYYLTHSWDGREMDSYLSHVHLHVSERIELYYNSNFALWLLILCYYPLHCLHIYLNKKRLFLKVRNSFKTDSLHILQANFLSDLKDKNSFINNNKKNTYNILLLYFGHHLVYHDIQLKAFSSTRDKKSTYDTKN